jgi:hypothetical protein
MWYGLIGVLNKVIYSSRQVFFSLSVLPIMLFSTECFQNIYIMARD